MISSVLIDASIEDVWATVIAFPKITDPPTGVFRFGIAYPIEASISPEFYWGAISDQIIHKIHYRVLNHIKEHTEGMAK